ncbi:MAG: UbiA family prenyltransferase [Verrucomicrobiota bacterium]
MRALLVLGRASNLPTVWSNCLAGWLLGGGGDPKTFALLCVGASFLYTGGMYLNDAVDAQFDTRYRRERPIPSGAIKGQTVLLLSAGWLGAGMLILALIGRPTFALSLILVACIIVYDLVHKLIAFSPLLMAGCRFFLYLMAASTAAKGVTGVAVWSAFAMAAYVIGLSYLARKESTQGLLSYWPCGLLAAPILLALLLNAEAYQNRALVLATLLGLWIVRSLRYSVWIPERNIGRTVSGLLAGIVLLDLLAVVPAAYPMGMIFLFLFASALLFQRFVPAT